MTPGLTLTCVLWPFGADLVLSIQIVVTERWWPAALLVTLCAHTLMYLDQSAARECSQPPAYFCYYSEVFALSAYFCHSEP